MVFNSTLIFSDASGCQVQTCGDDLGMAYFFQSIMSVVSQLIVICYLSKSSLQWICIIVSTSDFKGAKDDRDSHHSHLSGYCYG